MPFQIIRNDITKVKADAVVNTANPEPVIGGGTDSAIYKAAGAGKLLAERRKIGNIKPGQAVETAAFALKANYIIHTVGPAWIDGSHGERDILRSCYQNSLALADRLGCGSAAFPLIATGVYGFPKDEALQIALQEFSRFLLTHEMKLILVVFDRSAFELSGRLFRDIEEYIDEHEVSILHNAEYEGDGDRRLFYRSDSQEFQEHSVWQDRAVQAKIMSFAADVPTVAFGESLDEVLKHAGATFQQRLFQLIDESGMDDVTVYKRANIDRKVFSRIRCKPDYKPKKKTAVAFAIALGLDMPTMLDLLSRAEIAFSPSSKFDLIITYFVSHGVYDIYEINAALFKYGQPILGE